MASILVFLAALWIAVTGHRHSGSIALKCCQRFLENEFPEGSYRWIKSYRQLPGVRDCWKYLEFSMTSGETFCVLQSKAQRLKELVDSRSRGIAGVPGRPSLASPNIAPARPVVQEAVPTVPVEQEMTSTMPIGQEVTSTVPVGQEVTSTVPIGQEDSSTWPVGQEVTSTRPVVHEVTSTRPIRQEVVPTSGPPISPFPGLKEQNHGPGPSTQPFPPLAVAGPHGEEGTPRAGPSTAPFPGLKEEARGAGPSARPSPRKGGGTPMSIPSTAGSPGRKGHGESVGPSARPSPRLRVRGYQDGETSAGPGARGAPVELTSEGEASGNPNSPHGHRGPGEEHGERNHLYLLLAFVVTVGLVVIMGVAYIIRPTTAATQDGLVSHSDGPLLLQVRYSTVLSGGDGGA
ncbi:uncharacterized protein LOC144609527 [Rhinoraja longicauda]